MTTKPKVNTERFSNKILKKNTHHKIKNVLIVNATTVFNFLYLPDQQLAQTNRSGHRP